MTEVKMKLAIILFIGLQISIYAQGDYSLKYDHWYNWTEDGIEMKITVTGEVPFHTAENFAVMTKCQSGSDDSLDNLKAVSILEGQGEVTAKGEAILGDKSDPENLVEMTFEVPVKVKLKGKTWWVDDTCAEMWNLAYEESWTEQVNWQIISGDPEADAMAMSFLPKTLGGQVNKLEDKSLEFQRNPYWLDHPPSLEEEAFMNMGVPMKGKIKYTIKLPGAHTLGGEEDEQYDILDTQPHKDYKFIDLHWGSSLDQIKWNAVDLDKLPD